MQQLRRAPPLALHKKKKQKKSLSSSDAGHVLTRSELHPTNKSHYPASALFGGRLIAGAHPGHLSTQVSKVVQWLHDECKVTAFVDLTEDHELDHEQFDEAVAQLSSSSSSTPLTVKHFPIKDRFTSPKIADISQEVQTLLQQKNVVYLSCKGGAGRTGSVVCHALLSMNPAMTIDEAFHQHCQQLFGRPRPPMFGMTYHQIAQLHKLFPGRSECDDAKTMEANYSFFYTANSFGHQSKPKYASAEGESVCCFSQWHPLGFSIHGIQFPTGEHGMMVAKALFFKDVGRAKTILKYKTPATAKKHGRLVANFCDEQWKQILLDVLVFVNWLKFTQNDKARAVLLSTGQKTIVEASQGDRSCGIGMSEGAAKLIHPRAWPGLNLLGQALVIVRDLIQSGQEPTEILSRFGELVKQLG